ncbi:MAG: putative LPS assembly protein LptD, partial [Melioribacteraceae bacterium]|nr:putative LPS assembly protein LptD [Melioribacteraceae bacterium]
GQYFKNFGYFFAISDYMDLTLNADYYLRGGWGTRARYRYAKRYNYSGNFSAEYSKIIIGEDSDPDQKVSTDWKLGISHNQTITPTLRLDANLSFQTGTFLSNNSTALNELITQDITSNATLNKRWEESGNSLSLSYNRTQNLESGNIREVLPNITFNKSQFYPFRTSSSSRDEAWYEKIGMGYSGNLKFKRDKIDNELKERGGVQHSISINASPKIGYFNISPRVNYVEKWYNKKTQKVIEQIVDMNNAPSIINSIYQYNATDTVVNKDVHEINMLRTFTMGVSASTKLYGMLQPKLLGIEAFRHTLTPSVSYSYNPNFSEEKWGYYETFVHPDGTIERYDPYSKEIFGSVSSSESQNIGFNLGNVFEIKTTKDPTDTTSESKKITLLNLDASTGYNFTADSLKLSSLRLNYRTKIGEFLNFNGSSTYSFYDTDGQKQINEYMVNKGKGLFRLTDLSFSVSTSISGEKLKGEERTGKNEDEEEFSAFKDKNYSNSRIEEDTDFSIPWNLNLSYNYFFRKPGAAEGEATNSNLGINMGFNLAKNWKFGVRGNYDFIREQFSAPQITIYRDLECWEMNFSWYPIGQYTGFRFEIRMKAPELRDVKVTRRSGRFEGR